MTTASGALPKAQVYGLFDIFNSTNEKMATYYDKFMHIDKGSKRGYEEGMQTTALTYAPIKPEGVQASSEDIKQSFVTRADFFTVAKVFKITKEAYEDNLYKEKIGIAGLADMRMMRDSFIRTKDKYVAGLFDNGQNSAVVYGDGQPMFSAAHPSEVGPAQSNLSAYTVFGEAAVQDAFIKAKRTKSLEGNVLPLSQTMIMLPPEQQYDAERIFRSVLRAGTSNNDVNVFKDKVDIVINPYLQQTTGFTFFTDYKDDALTLFERQQREMRELPMEDDNVYRFMCDERYVATLFDFRKVFGTVGI